MIGEQRAQQMCDELTAAGDDWPTAAAAIAEIIDTIPGDGHHRDRCILTEPWAMGDPTGHPAPIPCRPVLYRDETGQWRPQGWSNASAGLIYRPLGIVYDEDAGTWIDPRTTEDLW